MLVSVRRNHPWHVCTALIVFSALAALPLIIAVSGFVPDALFSFSLYFTPEFLVVLLGWFGWIRMRRPPEAPGPGQFPYLYPMPSDAVVRPLQRPSPAVLTRSLPPAPGASTGLIPLVRAGLALAGAEPGLARGQDSPWSDGLPGR
ncbi:hypothetical protein [Propionibacterium australiense]|uniref:Uncharacterized protein n=1 Tax=Propionibacterium australiense TaxID=119981 RepID=A0A8B3FRF1_9ACTN|nr:hypothetical protein [Propionibacterium australiense]RLP09124.1 hypothetical protein D7U36_08320 [Propionibacterium australiense]